jgi:ribosomal protein S18 acetylase RimI-like enzyme
MVALTEFKVEHALEVAALHRDSLAEDFLPSLGLNFLETLYRGMIGLELAWGWVALEDGQVVGFVAATDDSRRLFGQMIRRRPLALSWSVARALLRRPRLLFPTLETFLYPSREGKDSTPAELLVIAVRGGRRSTGVGASLVGRLDETMASRRLVSYKVTVRAGNEGANRFYRKLGFALSRSFPMYRQQWNLYQKTASTPPQTEDPRSHGP